MIAFVTFVAVLIGIVLGAKFHEPVNNTFASFLAWVKKLNA